MHVQLSHSRPYLQSSTQATSHTQSVHKNQMSLKSIKGFSLVTVLKEGAVH